MNGGWPFGKEGEVMRLGLGRCNERSQDLIEFYDCHVLPPLLSKMLRMPIMDTRSSDVNTPFCYHGYEKLAIALAPRLAA